MATSFIKSFMEAVNPAAARAAKRDQDPQDPRVENPRQPQAASNALLDATSREALEEWPASPEIVVIPQTIQMGPMDDIDTVEIPADEVAPEDLPQRVIIHRRVPIESDEESTIDPDILTTIDETGSDTVILQRMPNYFRMLLQSTSLLFNLSIRSTLSRPC